MATADPADLPFSESTHDARTILKGQGQDDVPSTIGRFRVDEHLGSGAFGQVFRAWDTELHRDVALKIARIQTTNSREDFLREARTLAQLNHPGIVPIYDSGTLKDGRCYVVMKFVEGQTLQRAVGADPFEPAAAARLVGTVARAIHSAHTAGIVHRDLKPSNILIDAAGQPYVVDFGLARDERSLRMTKSEYAGTPLFMAPEQIQGDLPQIDGRTDIWGLGIILYYLLAGRMPFLGDTREELEQDILNRDPKPPRQMRSGIPAELERICLKCLSKNPSHRFSTAEDLAEVLDVVAGNAELPAGQRKSSASLSSLGHQCRELAVHGNVGHMGCGLTVTLAALLIGAVAFWGSRSSIQPTEQLVHHDVDAPSQPVPDQPLAGRQWRGHDGEVLAIGTLADFEDERTVVVRSADERITRIPIDQLSDRDVAFVLSRAPRGINIAQLPPDDGISPGSIVGPPLAQPIAFATEGGQSSLESVVDSISDRVEAYLRDKNQLQISIGEFNGPPGTSSGRKLKNMLEEELKSRDINVAPFSPWEVRGDFDVNTDGDFATVAVITRLLNQQGVEVADFRQRVRDSINNLKDVLDIAQPASVDLESAVLLASTNGSSGTEGRNNAKIPIGGNPPSSGTPPADYTPLAGGTAVAGRTAVNTNLQNTATAELPDDEVRDQRLIESLRYPGFHQINPSTIAASSLSPYHIQIKVQRAGSPTFEPIEIQNVGNGLAFCDLQEGDLFSVVITNTAPHDVGVELMIDGINSLHFSEAPAFAKAGKWLIRGTNNNGGVPLSARIDGWYRNPESVNPFRVSSAPDAVASQLGLPGKIGTITATFYGSWVGDDVHPLEAMLAAKLGTRSNVGIARGQEIVSSSSTIVERKFGRFPLASISVRYVNPDPPDELPTEPAN